MLSDGDVTERPNVLASKASEGRPSAGSNPAVTASALSAAPSGVVLRASRFLRWLGPASHRIPAMDERYSPAKRRRFKRIGRILLLVAAVMVLTAVVLLLAGFELSSGPVAGLAALAVLPLGFGCGFLVDDGRPTSDSEALDQMNRMM